MLAKLLTGALVLAGRVYSQDDTETQSRWGQCAGDEYVGPVACPTGFICEYGNPWYSQCILPEEAIEESDIDDPDFTFVPDQVIDTETRVTTITVIQNAQPTVVTTYITFLTPHPTSTQTVYQTVQQPQPTAASSITFIPDTPIVTPRPRARDVKAALSERRRKNKRAAKAAEPQEAVNLPRQATAPAAAAAVEGVHPLNKRTESPRTLVEGQYWIRAVVDPNYHKYLQTSPENTASVAVIESHTTAGQYQILDGQLVAYIQSEEGETLYMQVEHPEDLTQRKLSTWFNTTENAFGTFEWSGDSLTWSHPDVERQNLAAWLVCEGQELFINTGAYAYMTPEGCADQTIHYYNGADANL